jgi:hypothetical protein
MMSAWHYAVIALLIFSIGCVLGMLLYYKYGLSYTRERFAFRVFLTCSSLSSLMIFFIFGKDMLLGAIVDVINGMLGTSIPNLQVSASDKILACLIIFAIIYLGLRMHQNWPGAISTREHEAALVGIKPGILSGTLAVLEDITGRAPLERRDSGNRPHTYSREIFAPTETRAWHSWVARILQLKSNQIRIDELKDWYPERKLFIGRYGNSERPIGVLCSTEVPPWSEVISAINFIEAERAKPARVIVAVEKSIADHAQLNHDSISIDYCYREEMLDDLVDFTFYREHIRELYEITEIAEGYNFKLPDVYVPTSGTVRIDNANFPVNSVEDYVADWIGERSFRQLTLLGEYGQGKSVLALRLAYRFMVENPASGRVPLLISLGGRSPRTQSKLGLLAEWAAPYGISPQALLTLHEAGRLFLIFDGFDEMDLVGEAALRFEHFRTLWEFSRDRHAKIMITGRPNFFIDQLEQQTALNIRAASSEISFTTPIYIERFNSGQIALALRSFGPPVQEEITALLSAGLKTDTFFDLMARPSTLFLAANIWGEIKPNIRGPNSIRSAGVIDKFIRHAYERQSKKRPTSFLSTLEREYFMIGIAIGMCFTTRLSNSIQKANFQRVIAQLVDAFPSDLSNFEPASESKREPLKERLKDRDLLIETISTDVRSSGILVTDLTQQDTFKFAHKSFFEFLVAMNTTCTQMSPQPEKDSAINFAVYRAFSNSRGFMTSLFYPGAFSREMMQFSAEILGSIISVGQKTPILLPVLEAKLEKIGIRITSFAFAVTLFRGKFWPFIAYWHMIFASRNSVIIYKILAAFLRDVGFEGTKLERSLEATRIGNWYLRTMADT